MTEANTGNRVTRAQRERTLIAILDEKLEYIRKFMCDTLHTDDRTPDGGLRHRVFAWRLGDTEFHFTYTEVVDVSGTASYRIRMQPYNPGGISREWTDLQTLGDLDGELRRARKSKGKTAADLKAEANSKKHVGAIPENLILVGLTGSLAYGLDHDGLVDAIDGTVSNPSDVDTRGVFVAPTKALLGLENVRDLYEKESEDSKFHEIRTFLALCLKGNPERLEMLATARRNGIIYTVPSTVMRGEAPPINPPLMPGKDQRRALANQYGKNLIDIQDKFLSKRIIKTYGGYAKQQLYRIQSKKERHTKPAMHLIRLMITGIGILKHGAVDCDMSAYRDRLLAIRTQEMPLEEVYRWHEQLEIEFATLAETTKLPDEPDTRLVNELLLEVRKAHLTW